MTNIEKNELKKIIETQIATLTKELAYLKTQLKPVEKDCSLDNVYHAGRHQEQNITFHRFEEYTKRYNKLMATLNRVEREDYGVCKECEEDISIERLKLIPESEYCIDCMNELSKRSKLISYLGL